MTGPGRLFREGVKEATGRTWEDWVRALERETGADWSEERLARHIEEAQGAPAPWAARIALLYGQLLGRTPVGVTKDAGVQMGIRRTMDAPKERIWAYLLSPEGLAVWIGRLDEFRAERGFAFRSAEGVSGKLTVVQPPEKLRLTWQPPEWDSPSRLQFALLSAAGGKTTVAIHQEMLEDVYVRELMLRRWEKKIEAIRTGVAG